MSVHTVLSSLSSLLCNPGGGASLSLALSALGSIGLHRFRSTLLSLRRWHRTAEGLSADLWLRFCQITTFCDTNMQLLYPRLRHLDRIKIADFSLLRVKEKETSTSVCCLVHVSKLEACKFGKSCGSNRRKGEPLSAGDCRDRDTHFDKGLVLATYILYQIVLSLITVTGLKSGECMSKH